MIFAIVAAEIAFWLLLVGGLCLRYLARRKKLSSAVLTSVPLVDVALLTLVAVDSLRGAEPSPAHALAALYLGLTIAFGHATIAWADAQFQYRFAAGARPIKPAKGSQSEVNAIWREWLRLVLALLVACGILLVLIAIDGFAVPADANELAAHPYWSVMALSGIVTVVWFVAGPLSTARLPGGASHK